MSEHLSVRERGLRAIEFLVPAVAYFRVNRVLRSKSGEAADTRPDWRSRLSLQTDGIGMAGEIYAAEASRVEKLEEKVRSTLGYTTPFVPVVAAALAVAVAHREFFALAFGVLALIELASGYLVTLVGTKSRDVHMVTNEDLAATLALDVDKQAAWGAEKLYSAERNRWIGIDLHNAIWAVNASLARLATFLSISGVLLLIYALTTKHAQRLDH